MLSCLAAKHPNEASAYEQLQRMGSVSMATATFRTNPDFDGAATTIFVVVIIVVEAAVNEVAVARTCWFPLCCSPPARLLVTPPPGERGADGADVLLQLTPTVVWKLAPSANSLLASQVNVCQPTQGCEAQHVCKV